LHSKIRKKQAEEETKIQAMSQKNKSGDNNHDYNDAPTYY